MISNSEQARTPLERLWLSAGTLRWLLLIGTGVALVVTFRHGLTHMIGEWSRAEYSHGFLIPVVAVLMALQKRPELARIPLAGNWTGFLFVVLGLAVLIVGELATAYKVTLYAFLLTIFGTVFVLVGWRGIRILWAPLTYLLFMVPLPSFLYLDLSTQLQLLSSTLGVGVIRLNGISVFLEGNVIDLGNYKLQVAEACSGLRYIFPLMSFGFLCAYVYRGPVWQRLTLFFSTVPIAILMNSLRIGVIGILVEHWGIGAAEGFLHFFEGWVVFIICIGILLVEVVFLRRASGQTGPLRDALDLDIPARPAGGARVQFGIKVFMRPFLATAALLAATAIGSFFLPERADTALARQQLAGFPLQLDDWHGRIVPLEPEILAALKLDDYFQADFDRGPGGELVSFYVAYYGSQPMGGAAHSPRGCIPGGGWDIDSIQQIRLDIATSSARSMDINRVMVSKGPVKMLVYYWFQQRGRIVANEYLVKWYILIDSIVKHRTDGALVRLVTPLQEGETEASADTRLARFAAEIYPGLDGYIPD